MVRFLVVVALASAYGLAALTAGCSPSETTSGGHGGSVTGFTWKVDPISGLTGGRDLYSVSLTAKGDAGLAVGDSGLVIRWNGREWTADADAMAVAKGARLLSVAIDPTGKRALAVGEEGVILSWDGKAWKHDRDAESLAKSRSLFASDFDDKGRTAWVVGQYGVALHWNGAKWTRTPTPFKVPGLTEGGAPVDVFGMWAVRIEPNGVGAVASGNGNRILRWNGRTWKDDKPVPGLRSRGDAFMGMRSIALSKDGKKGWMIGNGATTLTWSGSKWLKAPTPAGKPDDDLGLNSLACDATGSTVFAVGQSGVVGKWDGRKWSIDLVASEAAQENSLHDVALDESGKVGFAVGSKGTLLRWDGTNWKRDPAAPPSISGDFSAIGMNADQTKGLAVSFNGRPMRWDGSSWKVDTGELPSRFGLNNLWVSPEGARAFGAGEDGVYEWNGSEWTAQPSPRSIHAMAFSEDGKLGFTGNIQGKIFRYDGSRWAEDKPATQLAGGKAIWEMALSGDGKTGFAAGSNTFLRWDGSRWYSDANLGKWSTVSAIGLSNDGSLGFVLGRGPQGEKAMRWNGKAWSIDREASKILTDSGPYELALSEDGQSGIAASFNGSVYFWNGKQWNRDIAGSKLMQGQRPISVWLDPTGRSGWVLGWKGFFARCEAVTGSGSSGK